MKIKIFEYSSIFDMDIDDMEEDINDFIKDKKVIDIKYDCCTVSKDRFEYITALVIYEEQPKNEEK